MVPGGSEWGLPPELISVYPNGSDTEYAPVTPGGRSGCVGKYGSHQSKRWIAGSDQVKTVPQG